MTGEDRGFDFVDDEDPTGRDEELARPGPGTLRARLEAFLRGRYGLPLVVVAAVLVYLVGRALLHERPAGAPPSSSASPSASRRTVAVDPGTGRALVELPLRTGSDPTRCPGLQCYTASTVPVAVRAAVRAAFPAARFTATETIRLVDRADGDPLWYREVIARTGTATLTLRVQARAQGDVPDGDARDDGSQSVTFLDARLQQWFVRARVVDRSGADDVLDPLSSLIADARLLST